RRSGWRAWSVIASESYPSPAARSISSLAEYAIWSHGSSDVWAWSSTLSIVTGRPLFSPGGLHCSSRAGCSGRNVRDGITVISISVAARAKSELPAAGKRQRWGGRISDTRVRPDDLRSVMRRLAGYLQRVTARLPLAP